MAKYLKKKNKSTHDYLTSGAGVTISHNKAVLTAVRPTYLVVSGSLSPSSAEGFAAGWPSSTAPSAPLCSFLTSPQVPLSWTGLHLLRLPPGPHTPGPLLDMALLALVDILKYNKIWKNYIFRCHKFLSEQIILSI